MLRLGLDMGGGWRFGWKGPSSFLFLCRMGLSLGLIVDGYCLILIFLLYFIPAGAKGGYLKSDRRIIWIIIEREGMLIAENMVLVGELRVTFQIFFNRKWVVWRFIPVRSGCIHTTEKSVWSPVFCRDARMRYLKFLPLASCAFCVVCSRWGFRWWGLRLESECWIWLGKLTRGFKFWFGF